MIDFFNITKIRYNYKYFFLLFISSVGFNSQAGISYQNCDILGEHGQFRFLSYIVNVSSQLIVRGKVYENEKEKNNEFCKYHSMLTYILSRSQKVDDMLPQEKALLLDIKEKFIAHYREIESPEEVTQVVENADFKMSFRKIIKDNTFKSFYNDCERFSASDSIHNYVLPIFPSGSIPAFNLP